jgi:uncharacterized delta-60 repeat protein
MVRNLFCSISSALVLLACSDDGGDREDPNAPLTVVSTTPAAGSTDAAPNGSIQVTFSHSLDPTTVTSETVSVQSAADLTVSGFGSVLNGVVAVSGRTVTFDPRAPLVLGVDHRILLSSFDPAKQIRDTRGQKLPVQEVRFRIAPPPHGALDLTFGDRGFAPFVFGGVVHTSIALQSDGTVVAAGGTRVVRYTAAGRLDDTFRAVTSDQVRAVVIQADGRIVVAATKANPARIVVQRYNVDGSRDPSFASAGEFVASLGAAATFSRALALQTDGGIIVAGNYVLGGKTDFVLLRLMPDGTPDGGFGAAGSVTTRFTSGRDEAHALVLQSDGSIVVSGVSKVEFDDLFRGFIAPGQGLLARYLPDGSLDASFGAGGTVVANVDTGRGLALHDGKILTAGKFLLRYGANGEVDPGFGTNGQVALDFGMANVGQGLAVQSDARILVAGSASLARFEANGTLDSSFGNAGTVAAVADWHEGDFTAVALQSDGGIVAGGTFVIDRDEFFENRQIGVLGYLP